MGTHPVIEGPIFRRGEIHRVGGIERVAFDHETANTFVREHRVLSGVYQSWGSAVSMSTLWYEQPPVSSVLLSFITGQCIGVDGGAAMR